jgi:hypothetical protein
MRDVLVDPRSPCLPASFILCDQITGSFRIDMDEWFAICPRQYEDERTTRRDRHSRELARVNG